MEAKSAGGANHDDGQEIWEFAAGGSFTVQKDSENTSVS